MTSSVATPGVAHPSDATGNLKAVARYQSALCQLSAKLLHGVPLVNNHDSRTNKWYIVFGMPIKSITVPSCQWLNQRIECWMAFSHVLYRYITEDQQAVRGHKNTVGESQEDRATHFRLLFDKFQEITTSYRLII